MAFKRFFLFCALIDFTLIDETDFPLVAYHLTLNRFCMWSWLLIWDVSPKCRVELNCREYMIWTYTFLWRRYYRHQSQLLCHKVTYFLPHSHNERLPEYLVFFLNRNCRIIWKYLRKCHHRYSLCFWGILIKLSLWVWNGEEILLTSTQTLAVLSSKEKARCRPFTFLFTVIDFIMCFSVFVESSLQQNSTTPATPYSSLPDSVLYPSLSGDVAQATASSNDYQALLPLDVNCILKPNSFDIGKMEEPTGRKKTVAIQYFCCFLSHSFCQATNELQGGKD